MFYIRFHSPIPIVYMTSSKFSCIGEWVSVSLPGWSWLIMPTTGCQQCSFSYFFHWHRYCALHTDRWYLGFNSLAPGRTGCHFKTAIFNLVLFIGIFTSSKDNALRWMPRDLTDDKSTLVQVMTWCLQATSHYLSQCWPRSMSPYGVTRPQWVNWSQLNCSQFVIASVAVIYVITVL